MEHNKKDLAIKGAVAFELSVSPRNEAEIDDGDEILIEELGQVIDNEIGTVWAKGLVIQSQGDFTRIRRKANCGS